MKMSLSLLETARSRYETAVTPFTVPLPTPDDQADGKDPPKLEQEDSRESGQKEPGEVQEDLGFAQNREAKRWGSELVKNAGLKAGEDPVNDGKTEMSGKYAQTRPGDDLRDEGWSDILHDVPTPSFKDTSGKNLKHKRAQAASR
ncbi:Hypothetical predicted protein [Pelobates cultripes]|uniref:Uncharacterized protein n=1 Tax=Pelobates cultripes TaxID=61616 RepID=A0AAD1REU9_PELCU|nr:Hypothetical predicted protein [Pelobates cultripes]